MGIKLSSCSFFFNSLGNLFHSLNHLNPKKGVGHEALLGCLSLFPVIDVVFPFVGLFCMATKGLHVHFGVLISWNPCISLSIRALLFAYNKYISTTTHA